MIRVSTDENGQRIISRHSNSHVYRLGEYTPESRGRSPARMPQSVEERLYLQYAEHVEAYERQRDLPIRYDSTQPRSPMRQQGRRP